MEPSGNRASVCSDREHDIEQPRLRDPHHRHTQPHHLAGLRIHRRHDTRRGCNQIGIARLVDLAAQLGLDLLDLRVGGIAATRKPSCNSVRARTSPANRVSDVIAPTRTVSSLTARTGSSCVTGLEHPVRPTRRNGASSRADPRKGSKRMMNHPRPGRDY